MLVQTKLEVCVGVRSGPKGPVIDLSIFGLEIPVQAKFKVCVGVHSGPRGPVVDIFICGGLPVDLEICSSARRLGSPKTCPNKLSPGQGRAGPGPGPGPGEGQGQGQGQDAGGRGPRSEPRAPMQMSVALSAV